ncbi:MAG TPA: protocatechuate 3,4-dioxygenase subunit alpha [Acidimicrobiales bacterium]|nr:protocatechuate 3,4-dioxygenase subunit alpha [Acidimicrobiales bacterium]
MSGATPSQTAGPFVSIGTGWDSGAGMAGEDDLGAIVVTGRLLDGGGSPITDALVEFWQADPEGRFPPECRPGWRGFARVLTDDDGRYRLVTHKPGPTGPGNSARAAREAPHIDVSIFARGLLQRLVTRVYFSDEAANLADGVLASLGSDELRSRLVARRREVAGSLGSGPRVPPVYDFDIHLQGDMETVFFAPW